jgi:hypothetical protein
VTLCKCHRRSGYEDFASKISFPETRRNRKFPVQASEDLWGTELYFGDQKLPLLLFGGEQLKRKLREDPPHVHVLCNSLACTHERPNLTVTWESITSAFYFKHLADLFRVFVSAIRGETTCKLSSTVVSPLLNEENYSKACALPMALLLNLC